MGKKHAIRNLKRICMTRNYNNEMPVHIGLDSFDGSKNSSIDVTSRTSKLE